MSAQPEHSPEDHEEIPHDEGTAEMQATRLGWVPQEQYKGKRPWIPAEEYLERLREDSPKLRHVNEKLARELEEVKNTNREILAHHERQLVQERQEAYDRASANIEARLEQAAAAGDTVGVKAIMKDQKALDAQMATPAQPVVAKSRMSAEDTEAVAEFKEQNSDWFDVDPEMTKFAQDYETGLMRKGVPLAQRLKMTIERVQRRFPQEFSDMNNDALDQDPPAAPARTPAPRSAPPGRNNSSSVRRAPAAIVPGSYEALTPKGKAACDAHVRAFAEPKKASAKATWLKYARNDSTLFQ